jgi:anti-sigma regulatory factor (Ser/Thr protein kinase)
VNESAPLRHHALVYESDDEYVAATAGFLKEGLDAGEAAIVANTRDGLAMMRDALGADAERVAFVDVSAVYTRPAHTVARYYGTFLEQLRDSSSVRAVANGQFGATPEEWREWMAYEAITNVAYSHLPVWVVCAYDAARLPDPVIDLARRTHPEVLAGDWHASDRFEDPMSLVRSLTPEPEPLPQLRSFRASDLEDFRERLAGELRDERVPEAKALEMLVAGTEVADNALIHGGGIDEVRAGRADGRFVCEVIDRGSGFDDPVAGYRAPREGVGTGLWVARQLAWRLETFQSPKGFTVRIWL